MTPQADPQIDSQRLLTDLRKELKTLEEDLRTRLEEVPENEAQLKSEYDAAFVAKRTAQTYGQWRDDNLTQIAAAWLLACVFVRFMEDNGLIADPVIAGPGRRGELAEEAWNDYFRRHPLHNDRDYLEHRFSRLADLPGAHDVFRKDHNPLWKLGPTDRGAAALMRFWRRVDPQSGALAHDFTDPQRRTRFLGDLYQDLSENVRKKYALLQTPDFVEEFILDRTLEPALETFGLQEARLIDPTCGSGHFLLGAFNRLFGKWCLEEPDTEVRVLAQRALDGVYGVDINPYAVSIARFRLLVAAIQACEIEQLAQAPDFQFNLATGDSLLHGRRWREFTGRQDEMFPEYDFYGYLYETEDEHELQEVFEQQFHAVVGNPPYITIKDKGLNNLYRERYPSSCHRQYSLGAPFTERFFDLALKGSKEQSAGFVGLITANTFMKREFGKKLIESFFQNITLTHVIDTSGAYIPGHGIPTVILFGRNQIIADVDERKAKKVRTILGIRGEPGTPHNPKEGFVWSSILEFVENPGGENGYISSTDLKMGHFLRHPWSLSGGGASELKAKIENQTSHLLNYVDLPIGRAVRIAEESVFIFSPSRLRRSKIPKSEFRGYLIGENTRDWQNYFTDSVWYPYGLSENVSAAFVELWPWRTTLAMRRTFQGVMKDAGLQWYQYMQHTPSAYKTPLSIAFAEVATHNHFVLDRGGKVFKQTAPVIKLPVGSPEEDHLALLGILNSSTACFWMKQVAHNKGSTVDQKGARQTTLPFEDFYQFSGTSLKKIPIAQRKPVDLAKKIVEISEKRQDMLPENLKSLFPCTDEALQDYEIDAHRLLRKLITVQEELDWFCYHSYGLIDIDLTHSLGQLPEISLGERAFEIKMATEMVKGSLEAKWFERHDSIPVSAIPNHWSESYRSVVEKRVAIIKENKFIRLIEQPEFKRRWNTESWESQFHKACKSWLLDRMETKHLWEDLQLTTSARLADRLYEDKDFVTVAGQYRGSEDYDFSTLIQELAEGEQVPLLPMLRFTTSGLRKHQQWKATWALQRREDSGEDVGNIPVPPKYTAADYLKTGPYYQLRGKLDVPKERFISFPFCEQENDAGPVIGWAGWDHLQRAQAVAAYYNDMKDNHAWPTARLHPLLACLAELQPWLDQWHNENDPALGMGLGDYFRTFVNDEARGLGLDPETLANWQPPEQPKKRARKKKATP
ncbi:MAG: BREX-2 system adenine-specific DNA-methyltransferase PglX [Acidobacteriota bacterium]|nr:BREX-2 system adenine-specific DNA-methyltransferase PglX [Acidobacteriota bacterium]